MWKCYKNQKVSCAIGGAAAVIVGKKILTAKKTRELAVTGLAKGMKFTHDFLFVFLFLKDDAADLCYDAQVEAGVKKAVDDDDEVTD